MESDSNVPASNELSAAGSVPPLIVPPLAGDDLTLPPTPTPSGRSASVRPLLVLLLSVGLGLYLADAVVSLIDESLIRLLDVHVLTWLRMPLSLFTMFLALVIYGLMGLLPETDACATCAGAIRHDALHSYSRRSGGFVCATCAHADSDVFDVPAGALAWLDASSRLPFDKAVGIGLGAESLAALKSCMLDLARLAVDTPLRTLKSGLV